MELYRCSNLTNANSAENISVNYTFCAKSRKKYKQNIFKNICIDYIICLYGTYHTKIILPDFFNKEIEFTIVLAHRGYFDHYIMFV